MIILSKLLLLYKRVLRVASLSKKHSSDSLLLGHKANTFTSLNMQMVEKDMYVQSASCGLQKPEPVHDTNDLKPYSSETDSVRFDLLVLY